MVSEVQASRDSKPMLENPVAEIKRLQSFFEECVVKHVYREFDGQAHNLARYA